MNAILKTGTSKMQNLAKLSTVRNPQRKEEREKVGDRAEQLNCFLIAFLKYSHLVWFRRKSHIRTFPIPPNYYFVDVHAAFFIPAFEFAYRARQLYTPYTVCWVCSFFMIFIKSEKRQVKRKVRSKEEIQALFLFWTPP